MPRGPKPLGERAMTPAERQARYRAAHATDTAGTVKVRYRRPADRRKRPQRSGLFNAAGVAVLGPLRHACNAK